MFGVRFAIFTAALIILLAVAMEFVEERYGPISGGGSEGGGVGGGSAINYQILNLSFVNITVDDLNATLLSWRFETAKFGESPLTLNQSGSGFDLREALLELLSRGVKDVTMEQYSVAGKLLGVFTLQRNGTVDYPILSPYDSFVFRFDRVNFTVPDVTYPPSADVRLSGFTEAGGSLSEDFEYKGYSTGVEGSCDDFGCWFYPRVDLNFDRIVRIGSVKGYEYSTTISFYPSSLGNGECGRYSRGCTGGDSYCVQATICRSESGSGENYSVSNVQYWFKVKSYSGTVRYYRIAFDGYHGEKNLNLTASCYHRYTFNWNTDNEEGVRFSVTITQEVSRDKSDYRWTKVLTIPVFRRSDARADVSCSFGVDDVLSTPIGNVSRRYDGGSLSYYYIPSYCVQGGSCYPPRENAEVKSNSAPAHVKKPFSYDANNTTLTEEFLLRAYAEAARVKVKGHVNNVLDKIASYGQWEAYFLREGRENAEAVLTYLYLSQIPLNVKVNESCSNSRLKAFLSGEGNGSVVATLHTFFENATFVYSERVKIMFGLYGERQRPVETNVTLALVHNTTFTKDGVVTDCGVFAVSELAYYRQPALQAFSGYYSPPSSFTARKGYTSLEGVKFSGEELLCRVLS